MSRLSSRALSVSAILVILLLGPWSCSSVGTGGGLSAEGPVLRLTGWILEHGSIPRDASQDFGAIKVRTVIRRYSTAEELQEIRRLAEAGDEAGFHKAFGRLEVASVEYPTAGGLRQRCYAAMKQPSPQGVRILLFSEGTISPVEKLWVSRITEFVLNQDNEGEGWVYRSRVAITEEGDIVFERVTPGAPGQITNVRPIK